MQLSFLTQKLQVKSSPYRDHFYQLLQGDLDFHGENSTYSSHSLHAFPAKFPPQLPRVFIENLTASNDVVLDPMMGSGTTLLEAVMLGRRAVGIDIDPLALRISHTKLSPKTVGDLENHGLKVAERAEKKLNDNPSKLNEKLQSRFDEESLEFINYWFLPRTQLELLALLEEIEVVQDDSIRSFLLLNFSAIIITKSGGVSLALDLAHTRPHRVISKKIHPAIQEFQKRLKRNLKSISDDDLPRTEFLTVDATIEKLPIMNNSVDLIVTSPPYANNAIDYMRAHKFTLVWMGHSISNLGKARQSYIGADAIHGINFLPLPIFAHTTVESIGKADKKKAQGLHRYYSEMTFALGEMYRVLKPEKAAVIVVGNSVLRGISTETDRCLAEIGKEVGFDLIHIGVRNLDRDKRMLPVRKNGYHGTISQIEERMHREYVIGFMKPGG